MKIARMKNSETVQPTIHPGTLMMAYKQRLLKFKVKQMHRSTNNYEILRYVKM
jgi:hypothetical protein